MKTEWEQGDEEEFFEELKKEFESAFWELIPGILHDFANPLSAILGRSELLECKVKKAFKLIDNDNKIDSSILGSYRKIIYDAGLVTEEANRFFDLFNDVAGKIRALNDAAFQKINLSELIKTETAFLHFYPDVKHNIKKKLSLDKGIPKILGVKADYSISLSAIIRHSVNSMKDSKLKELLISTGYDDSHVYVKIKDTGAAIAGRKEILENLGSTSHFLHDPDGERILFCALSLLKKYGALFQIAYESGFNVISIRIPY